jgi:hypothetical protein
MKESYKSLRVDIPETLHKRFKKKVSTNDTYMAVVIRKAVIKYVKEKVDDSS